MSELLHDVSAIVRDVFGDEDITLTESTTADDVEGWDSLMHLNLMIALEKRFRIRFSMAEIARLKEDGQNVGSILQLIAVKTGTPA